MLSTEPVKDAAGASHYFLGHDNYYSEGETLAKDRSQWWGKGSQVLGLSGTVDSELFTQLLKGKLTSGQQLGKVEDETVKHRPGFDLTFSAPKSVSLLALLGGDERIFAAVTRATDKALALIERDLAKARITRNGITDYQKTGNLVVAKFLHDLSREGDPQLHTHCVVMNMTQRQDGQWRSLASEMRDYGEKTAGTPDGFLEAVRHHTKFYGAIFRAELAYEMKQLGYTPVQTEPGFFEIAGISPAVITAFSQRRQDIEAYLKQHHLSGAKEAALATLKTRQAKQKIDRETLLNRWQAKEALFDLHAFDEVKRTVEQAHQLPDLQKQPTFSAAEEGNACLAVQQAMAHLSETRVVLQESDLVQQALQYSLTEVPVESIFQAISNAQALGELIRLPAAEGNRHENYFTTNTLLRYEQELLQSAMKPHSSQRPLVSANRLNTYLKAHAYELTLDQKEALRVLVHSTQQMTLLAGSAGSGKTHVMQHLCDLAKIGGYQPILLTTSKAQNLDLKTQLKKIPDDLRAWLKTLFDNRQFQTVAGYMHQQDQLSPLERRFQKKPLLLLEHANLLSSRQFLDLAQLTERLGGRLIPVGDAQSTLGWQAGSPFTQMLKAGVTAARLQEDLRPIPATLKTVVADTLQNQLQAAFKKLGQRVFSVADSSQRTEMMAEQYASLPPAERAATCLLMPGKTACDTMNQAVRAKLKAQQEITSSEVSCSVLLPRTLSAVERQWAKCYSEGQWVRFAADFRSLGVKRGDYRCVTGIDVKRNTVFLTHPRKPEHPYCWHPDQVAVGKTTVFDADTRTIATGDVLAWRQNNKTKGLHNGERVTVLKVDEKNLRLRLENGKSIQLNLSKPESRHFDYGYAFTPQQKYHAHPDTVIAYQNSHSRQSHQRAFYKLLGQAKQQAWIYTEDREQLLTQLQQHSGDKITAIDALLGGELPKSLQSATEHLQLLEAAVQKALSRMADAATPESLAKEAVAYALAHLSEREAAFSHKEVLGIALNHALGDVNPKLVQDAVVQAEKNGDLLRGACSLDGTFWTTRSALEMEQKIIDLAKETRGQMPSLVAGGVVTNYIASHSLSREQSTVLTGAMAQPDRFMLFQGFAGTRKTTLLTHVQAILPENQELLCLAPTHQAVKELKARGLNGQTVASFLTHFRTGKLDLPQDRLVIAVDESSMISNRGLQDFLRAGIQLNARGFIIGDTHQYASIESGKPFALLQKAGIHTLQLTDITRQNNPTLKEAIQATYHKEFVKAFKILEKSIIEIPNSLPNDKNKNQVERMELISDYYIKKNPRERSQTLIITLTNSERIELNAIIREKLAQHGELHGDSLVTQVLVPRKLTETELTRAGNFRLDDQVRFNISLKQQGLEKDQYYTVVKTHPKENMLELMHDSGKKIIWKLPHFSNTQSLGVEVYRKQAREIQAGDLIRWTRTDKTLGLISPEMACVQHVQNKTVFVQAIGSAHGDPVPLNLEQLRYQHWDHAYAITGYSAQGKTIPEVVFLANSRIKRMANQPSFLVAITRAVEKLTIYTDNKAALLDEIRINAGEKRSALEILGQLPYDKSHNTNELPLTKAGKNNSLRDRNLPEQPPLDAKRIHQMLTAETEAVVTRLLGEPKSQDGNQYRYGSNKGSLVITLAGDKRGLWHDFQSGQGGNLFSLIAKQCELNMKRNFKQVLQEAVRILGISAHYSQYAKDASKSPSQSKSQHTPTPQQEKILRYAKQLARESRPVEGTLAERYLREHRGIHLAAFPEDIRFHPGVYSKINGQISPALLVIAKDNTQTIQAVQAIFLDPETGKKAAVKVQKQTFGSPSKGMVQLEKTPSSHSPTYLAEGVETGLSIYMALRGGDVRVTLGKSNFDADFAGTSRHVVLCLDNDGNNPHTETLTQRVAATLQNIGKTVWVAKPETIKEDYNDVLLKQGSAAVAKAMEEAISYANYREQTASDIMLKTVLDREIHKLSTNLAANRLTTNVTIQSPILDADSIKTPIKLHEKNHEPEL
ncbi:MAG TPA: conjugative transfer relaxase/helicase TraI [Gammaproteobacteria bacterium]|nr:conjugative transfer relaxase/helicase TraI [Gammaproteobacteria bacterium]